MLKLVQNTILTCLFVNFLFAGSTFGAVLCIHPDGDVQVESALNRCCDSPERGGTSVLEEDACVDIAIEASQQVIASQKTAIQVDYRVDSVPVDLHCFLAPRIPTGFHPDVLTRTSHSPPNTTLRALRSVMLLI